jgi:hypothetical protein
MQRTLILLRRLGRHRYGPHLLVAGMVAMHACSNSFAMYAVTRIVLPRTSEAILVLLVGLVYGFLAGQFVTHSSWAVLWDRGGAWRVILGGLAAFILYLSITVPVWFEERAYLTFQQVILAGILGLPAVVIACQTPLWIMKCGLRWHISITVCPKKDHQHKPLTIRGLLIATTSVAVAITCLRVGLTRDIVDLDSVIVFVVGSATITLLLGVPTMFFVLWMRRFYLGWACLNVCVFVIPFGIIVAGMMLFWQPRIGFWSSLARGLGAFTVGYGLSATIPLLAARLMGARLHRA